MRAGKGAVCEPENGGAEAASAGPFHSVGIPGFLVAIIVSRVIEFGPPRLANSAINFSSPESLAQEGALCGYGLTVVLLGACVLGAYWWLSRSKSDGGQFDGHAPQATWCLDAVAVFLLSNVALSTVVHRVAMDRWLFEALVCANVVSAGLAFCAIIQSGVQMQDIRAASGLGNSEKPLTEVGVGVCASVAVLAVTAIVMLCMPRLAGVAHPELEVIRRHEPWRTGLAITDALVIGPTIEEICFRGLLYRHLRAGLRMLGSRGRIGVSSVACGFAFFAVHPQGWSQLAPLMITGIVLCLVREWRQSLLPCIVAHSMLNGIVVTMVALNT